MNKAKRITFRIFIETSVAVILVVLAALPLDYAQSTETTTAFTHEDYFQIPYSNGTTSFVFGGSYQNAILQNNIWEFTGLLVNNSNSYWLGKNPLNESQNNGKLGISSTDSNVTIFVFDILPILHVDSAEDGWLNYSVSGVGKQTIKLYYDGYPLGTIIYIDNVAKPQNTNWTYVSGKGFTAMGIDDSWTFSPQKGFTVIGATSSVSIHYFWEPMPPLPRGSDFNLQSGNFNIAFFVIEAIILITIVVAAIILVTKKIPLRAAKNSS